MKTFDFQMHLMILLQTLAQKVGLVYLGLTIADYIIL